MNKKMLTGPITFSILLCCDYFSQLSPLAIYYDYILVCFLKEKYKKVNYVQLGLGSYMYRLDDQVKEKKVPRRMECITKLLKKEFYLMSLSFVQCISLL